MNSSKPFPSEHAPRGGFSLLELFVVIFIIAVLLCMSLPFARTSRGAVRRTVCANNMRNLILAVHNYESVHGHFPAAMGGLEQVSAAHEGADRLSGVVMLLPYLEQNALWDTISNPSQFNGNAYPPGPAPWEPGYEPWQSAIPGLQCPTAGNSQAIFGLTNYAFCIGDRARDIHQPADLRGAFACGIRSNFGDLFDGASQTIAMAEIGSPHNRQLIGQYAIGQSAELLEDPNQCLDVVDSASPADYCSSVQLSLIGRGGCWANGSAENSLFNTILPPGSPSCAVGGPFGADGIYSAGSEHPGGVNISMMDASVHYMTNTVDTGDMSQPTPTRAQLSQTHFASPYGIWGSLGTVAGDEEIEW